MLANCPDKMQNSVVKNNSTGISNENQLQGFEMENILKGLKLRNTFWGHKILVKSSIVIVNESILTNYICF
jgi:hypothetical protein